LRRRRGARAAGAFGAVDWVGGIAFADAGIDGAIRALNDRRVPSSPGHGLYYALEGLRMLLRKRGVGRGVTR
jgi:hypothetical protein